MGALLALVACFLVATESPAQEPSLDWKVRVEWGGGEGTWRGEAIVARGAITQAAPLGSQADEAAAYWLHDGRLDVRSPSPRNYFGYDLAIVGSPDATLRIELTQETTASGSPPAKPTTLSVDATLTEITAGAVDRTLSDGRTRVTLRRAPGDALRVRFERPHLVFAPKETFKLALQPHQLPIRPTGRVEFEAAIVRSASNAEVQRLAIPAVDAPAGESAWAAVPVEFQTPEAEGVYELRVALVRRTGLSSSIARNWGREALASRVVQFVVVSNEPTQNAILTAWQPIDEFDPTHPSFLQRIGLGAFASIPSLRKGPLTAGDVQVWTYNVGDKPVRLVQLGAGDRPGEPSWQAYPIRVQQPGFPHLLEIEYPADLPQNLGVSLVEPGPNGAGPTAIVESGIHTPDEAALSGPKVAVQRIVFWPKTKTPFVLLTNRRPESLAAYGRLRVSACGSMLPREVTPRTTPGRSLAYVLQKPLLAESFAAPEVADLGGAMLKDWTTFYEAAKRLFDVMRVNGRDSLIVCVSAEGGALFPSLANPPTPRYDPGAFFSDGRDPVRKDVLELLMRLGDRDGVKVIPLVRFTAAHERIERQRVDPQNGVGVDLVGADGLPFAQSSLRDPETRPSYNPLDPRVQQIVFDSVHELTARYGGHKSFGGAALDLSADGFAILPGEAWGLDDRTWAAFEAAVGVRTATTGAQRFAERAKLVSAEPLRSRWLSWRAETLANLHQHALAEIRRRRPDAKLYLHASGLWDSSAGRKLLRERLAQGAPAGDALLAVGIGPRFYQGPDQPILLRPYRVAPPEALPAGPLDEELNETWALDQEFPPTPTPGVVFLRPAFETTLASFVEKGPFRGATPKLFEQAVPAGAFNRRRFVQALAASDAILMGEGGWLAPTAPDGDAKPILDIYRALPPRTFQPLVEATQPLVVRYDTDSQATHLYAVNDSPWPARLKLRTTAPATCKVEGLAGTTAAPLVRLADGAEWATNVEAYGLVAVKFHASGVRFYDPEVVVDPAAEPQLKRQVDDLAARVATLAPMDAATSENAPLMAWNLTDRLTNPGFETVASRDELLPGWSANVQTGVACEIVETAAHSGKRACKLASDGPIATLAGPTFDPPRTGVLLVSVWLRVDDATRQPPLRLAVEAERPDGVYYRFAAVGAGAGSPRIDGQWRSYLFWIDALPLAGLRDMRVRFDLMGPGEVWLDDVRASSVLLTPAEITHLRRVVQTARFALGSRRVGDVQRALAGFWPQRLASELPLTQTAVEAAPESISPQPPTTVPPPAPPAAASWYDRLMPSWFR